MRVLYGKMTNAKHIRTCIPDMEKKFCNMAKIDANLKGDDALDTMLRDGALPIIEDLPDGGEIWKNDDCKRCAEFYSGNDKI